MFGWPIRWIGVPNGEKGHTARLYSLLEWILFVTDADFTTRLPVYRSISRTFLLAFNLLADQDRSVCGDSNLVIC